MKITKRINHNAALAIDNNGNELVVLGKGVGFPSTPYELSDLSQISRTFYDVDSRYAEMVGGLPQPVLLASADIIEQAEINLDCELNSNVTFTLADHLNFAIERLGKGLDIATPLSYDIEHLYPQEYELGLLALDIVQDYTKKRLPDNEIVSIALHLINAEIETGDMHSTLMTIRIITDISAMIEEELDIKINKTSFQYSRFTMHVRYLIQRLSSGKQLNDGASSMLHNLITEYPKVYGCACRVTRYFKETWSWECSKEETLYLMLHIGRLREKND